MSTPSVEIIHPLEEVRAALRIIAHRRAATGQAYALAYETLEDRELFIRLGAEATDLQAKAKFDLIEGEAI